MLIQRCFQRERGSAAIWATSIGMVQGEVRTNERMVISDLCEGVGVFSHTGLLHPQRSKGDLIIWCALLPS